MSTTKKTRSCKGTSQTVLSCLASETSRSVYCSGEVPPQREFSAKGGWQLDWMPCDTALLHEWIAGTGIGTPSAMLPPPAALFSKSPRWALTLAGVGIVRGVRMIEAIEEHAHQALVRMQALAPLSRMAETPVVQRWRWGYAPWRDLEATLQQLAPEAGDPSEAMRAITLLSAPPMPAIEDLIARLEDRLDNPVLLSFEDELGQMAQLWGEASLMDTDRVREVVCCRAGLRGREARSIASIGERLDVSPQRAHQLVTSILAGLPRDPQLPSLERFLAAVREMLPATKDQLRQDAHLRELLGGGHIDPLQVMRFVERDLGRAPVSERVQSPSPVSETTLTILMPPDDPAVGQRFAALRRVALAQLRAVGAVMLSVALDDVEGICGARVSRKQAEGYLSWALELTPLDAGYEHDSWWAPREAIDSAMSRAIRKVLACADRAVDIDDLVSGIQTIERPGSPRPHHRDFQPSPRVVLALAKTIPDIRVRQHDDLILLGDHEAWRTAMLSEAEIFLYRAITHNGGIFSRGQIPLEIARQGAQSGVQTVSLALATAPMIRRIERGLYGLRGVSFTPEAMANAQSGSQGSAATAQVA